MAQNGASISVSDPVLTCIINEQSFTSLVNSNFNLSVSIADQISLNPINNINWNVNSFSFYNSIKLCF